MKITYRKKFLKELARVPSTTRMKMEAFFFEALPREDSIFKQINISR
jgi:hypothetical protein